MSALALLTDTLAIVPTLVPDPDPEAPPGFEGAAATIIGWMRWGGLILAVIGIIIVAAKIMINIRRGEAAGELGGLGYIAIGVVLIGAASSLVGFLIGV